MQLEDIRLSDKALIVGIGSALVDLLVRADDAFIEQAGGVKGGMTLVESDTIDKTVARAGSQPEVVPGGSACNTVVGVGNLGVFGRFVGKRGSPALGVLFENGLNRYNVEPLLF